MYWAQGNDTIRQPFWLKTHVTRTSRQRNRKRNYICTWRITSETRRQKWQTRAVFSLGFQKKPRSTPACSSNEWFSFQKHRFAYQHILVYEDCMIFYIWFWYDLMCLFQFRLLVFLFIWSFNFTSKPNNPRFNAHACWIVEREVGRRPDNSAYDR